MVKEQNTTLPSIDKPKLIKILLLLIFIAPIALLINLFVSFPLSMISEFRQSITLSAENPSLFEEYLNNFNEKENLYINPCDYILIIKRLLFTIFLGPIAILGNLVFIISFPVRVFL